MLIEYCVQLVLFDSMLCTLLFSVLGGVLGFAKRADV